MSWFGLGYALGYEWVGSGWVGVGCDELGWKMGWIGVGGGG